MADVPFATNLLPSYQTPQAMAQAAATTANTQANTGYIGAQTQGAQIANQGAALKLGLLQNYYQQNQPGTTSTPAPSQGGSPSDTVGGTSFSPDQVSSGIISKYAPIPTAPPPSAVAQDAYAKSIGAPEMAVATYNAQVSKVNQQRQLGANGVYQMAQTVASAPDGAAFDTFNRINPQAAAALKAAHPSDDPSQLDADARLLAQHTGIAVHQYTGRDTDFQNGVLVDKKDGKPVLGSEQVLTGLDAAGKEKAFASANEPVTIGNSLPQPRWQQAGFPNAEAYVIAADKAARSSAANSSQPDSAAAEGPPTPTSAAPKATAQPKPGAAPGAPATGGTATTDPVLKTALSDSSYRWQQPFPKPTTQEQQSANVDAQKATVAASQTLKTQSDQAVAAAASAQTYLQAAKAIIDSKGAAVGAYGGLISKASSFLGDYKGDASNYQELAKYLNNAAIAAAKGNYGSGLTEKELELQLTGASPSVDKTPGALKDLVEANLRNSKYTLDTANRVVPYLKAGNDPTNFNKWNQSNWNQSATVNPPKATSSSTAMPSGDKLNAYAAAHFGGDTGKAQAYLQSQGFK